MFSPACGPFEYRTHHLNHEFLQAFILLHGICWNIGEGHGMSQMAAAS